MRQMPGISPGEGANTSIFRQFPQKVCGQIRQKVGKVWALIRQKCQICFWGADQLESARPRLLSAAGRLKGTKYKLDPSDNKDGHATYIVDLAYALSHNTGDVFLCMTENFGIISNFSEGAMVEVPCHMGIHGPEAINVGEIPAFQKGILENQFAYEKLTVDANLEGSYRKAWQALTLNRLVNDKDTAKALLDDYIVANKGYWPELR